MQVHNRPCMTLCLRVAADTSKRQMGEAAVGLSMTSEFELLERCEIAHVLGDNRHW
jgi:hypothetical protein